jgi:hypothetical protein
VFVDRSPTPTPTPAGGLSTGAKAGIGVGVPLGVVLIAVLILFLFRVRRRRKRTNQRLEGADEYPAASDKEVVQAQHPRRPASPSGSSAHAPEVALSVATTAAATDDDGRGAQQQRGVARSPSGASAQAPEVQPVPHEAPPRSGSPSGASAHAPEVVNDEEGVERLRQERERLRARKNRLLELNAIEEEEMRLNEEINSRLARAQSP